LTKPDVVSPKADYLRLKPTKYSSIKAYTMVSEEEETTETTTQQAGNSTLGATVAQKLRFHIDLEAPIMIAQAPTPPPATKTVRQNKKRRIPIQAEQSQQPHRQQLNPSPEAVPAVQSPAAAPTTAAVTNAPTAAPTNAPTPSPGPKVRQFQVATIVRSREVPASDVQVASPTEAPIMIMQEAPRPAATVQSTPVQQVAVQPMQIPIMAQPAPQRVIMEAHVSPAQQQAIENQQVQQRQALLAQQEQQRQNMMARQIAQRNQMQRPVNVAIQASQQPVRAAAVAVPIMGVAAAPVLGVPMGQGGQPGIVGQPAIGSQSVPVSISGGQGSPVGNGQGGAQGGGQVGNQIAPLPSQNGVQYVQLAAQNGGQTPNGMQNGAQGGAVNADQMGNPNGGQSGAPVAIDGTQNGPVDGTQTGQGSGNAGNSSLAPPASF
jgi:hypothetical protein